MDFEYDEVVVESERGMELVERHSIASVPTSIIDGRVLLRGVPIRGEVESVFNPSGKLLESRL